MQCRHCGSVSTVRNGFIRSIQQWKCRDCGRRFQEICKKRLHSVQERQDLVRLYCSGLSYSRSAKLKGVSHTTARRWVKQYAEGLPEKPESQATVVELDEQCAQLGKKEK